MERQIEDSFASSTVESLTSEYKTKTISKRSVLTGEVTKSDQSEMKKTRKASLSK